MSNLILSISKFGKYTAHYYGRLYKINININKFWRYDYNNFNFKDFCQNLESNSIIINKNRNEKELIKKTIKIIQGKFKNIDKLLVFYQGNYSKSRTEFINNLYKKGNNNE